MTMFFFFNFKARLLCAICSDVFSPNNVLPFQMTFMPEEIQYISAARLDNADPYGTRNDTVDVETLDVDNPRTRKVQMT